jgi:hypothetical protein
MRKYFYIDGELKCETVEKFIDFVNENHDSEITVFIDSNGGWNVSAQAIAVIINDHHERFRMVSGGTIFSAAFWLFFSVKCERKIQEGTIGCYHLVRQNLEIMSNGAGADRIQDYNLKNLKKDWAKSTQGFCDAIGLTQSEIKSIMSGKETFFDTERLRELL